MSIISPFSDIEEYSDEDQLYILEKALSALNDKVSEKMRTLLNAISSLEASAQTATVADFDEKGLAELKESLVILTNATQARVSVVEQCWNDALEDAISAFEDEEDPDRTCDNCEKSVEDCDCDSDDDSDEDEDDN